MNARRAASFTRQCARKGRWFSARKIRLVLRRMRHQGDYRVYAYRCPLGTHFHFGHHR